jgi:DNA-binding NarL/FixJ family response regulator
MLTRDPILVIDETPLIAVGVQEVLRSLQPEIRVEYAGNIFTALSSKLFSGQTFSLIVLGSVDGHSPCSTLRNIEELKAQFPGARIMLYTDQYNPEMIGKVEERLLDAYVHKHEDVGEVSNALIRIFSGETYLSPMLDMLYHTWRFNR